MFEAAREGLDRPPSALVEALFGTPNPFLEWTGDGVRRDAAGRMQFIRHAMDADARTSATDLPSVEVRKLLVVEPLRSQSHADFRTWLAEHGGCEIAAKAIADVVTDSGRTFRIGEQIVIGYEPRLGRTRILWPWKTFTDAHEPVVMQALWRCYFDARDQPELRAELLRWRSIT